MRGNKVDQITLNNTLQLSGLECFRIMDEDEIAGYRMGLASGGVCLCATEKHMIISTAWKKEGGFLARLFGYSDLVRSMESCYRRSFKQYGFNMDGYLERETGGVTANGLRYRYNAQDIDMTGESYALEKDGIVYYLHVYYRTAFSEECRKIWNAILDTAKWQ